MRRRACSILALSVLSAACEEAGPPAVPPAFEPTSPRLLSTGSPTKDEDPSVLLARDGSVVVAWFSDRGGNNDIYLTRTTDGTTWAPAVRVTLDAGGDFYPNLFQDDAGVFHLVWFRWYALERGHVVHNRSTDPLTWDPATEDSISTTPDVDDWVPTITGAGDSLIVFFVSERRDATNATHELYLSIRRPGRDDWDAPVAPAGLNSAAEHDHLPFVARTAADEFTLVWVRHDTSQPAPWLSPPPTSHLYYARSPDGTTWSAPAPITNDAGAVVNVFPSLYRRQNGTWRLGWLSTRTGPPALFELPLAGLDGYPAGIIENTHLPPGYSHRVAATPVAGAYLGAWVQGPDGAQDVYYRVFRP